jgi:hypothetical protein
MFEPSDILALARVYVICLFKNQHKTSFCSLICETKHLYVFNNKRIGYI